MSQETAILVSRFPESITPGALPLLPALVSIHDNLLTGGFLVFRWFATGGEHFEQAVPERHETLAEAWSRVPSGYVAVACPAGFGLMAYQAVRQ